MLILCIPHHDIVLQSLQEILLGSLVLSLYIWIYCGEITCMTDNKATKFSNGDYLIWDYNIVVHDHFNINLCWKGCWFVLWALGSKKESLLLHWSFVIVHWEIHTRKWNSINSQVYDTSLLPNIPPHYCTRLLFVQ